MVRSAVAVNSKSIFFSWLLKIRMTVCSQLVVSSLFSPVLKLSVVCLPPSRVSELIWCASSAIRMIGCSAKSSIVTLFSRGLLSVVCKPCMVVKQKLMQSGLAAWKFCTSFISICLPLISIFCANRYLLEAEFRKLSRVFSTIFVLSTKNRKLR